MTVLFSLYQRVFTTFIQIILEYSVNINYSLIGLLHYLYHWTDEPKLKVKLRSKGPHNSCIQRRTVCVSKTEKWGSSKKQEICTGFLWSCIMSWQLLRNQERLACIRCTWRENRVKYPVSCYSFWPLHDTSFGSFPAEIKPEVLSILPVISESFYSIC